MDISIVQINNLTKQYRNGKGIRGLSLSIGRGQVYGLLGPNGSGKTTTMKAITGLLQPDAGEVFLMGRNIEDGAAQAMEGVGCIIEEPGFYPYMTARQNMELVGRLSGINGYSGMPSGDAIDHMLQRMGLGGRQREKVSKYSMGMKQRLGLAMTLLPEPELLILDEPSNGLDIEGRALVRSILNEQREQGKTILISSHLADEIEHVCTHVGIIRNGELLGSSSMANLMKTYGSVESYYLNYVNREELAS